MKTKILFFVLMLLFFSSLIYSKNVKENSPFIDSNVLTKLNEGENKVRVIVVLKDEIQKKNLGIFSNERISKEEIKIQAKKLIKNKVKHDFIYTNAFSTELNSEEIDNLIKSGLVERIYYDYPVQFFLQDSTPLINATSSWKLQVNGFNLTGAGQTICIIDTGVNYSHNDLGGCNPVKYLLNGTIENLTIPVQSEHPYQDNFNYMWSITKPGYEKIAVHFKNISLEYPGQGGYDSLDRIIIYDSQMREIARYHGINGVINDLWTPYSEGDTVYVRLITDEAVTDYGFYIDKVINGTTNTTYDFSSCEKIVGGWDFVNNDGDQIDDHGHGTHVAGIVAANGNIKGVAPDAKIVAVKSLNSTGGGFSSDVIAGIEFCINRSSDLNISVISMSLGGGLSNTYCDSSDPLTAQLINLAVSKNISVVVATGNNNQSNKVSYPACIYNSTRVGSTTKTDTISSFSNRWALEILFAPGSSINSTSINGNYETMGGTSMATPHVSGAIALIKQYLSLTNRSMTPKQIENVLNKTGKKISADGREYSRIDVFSAIISLDEDEPVVNLIFPIDKEENITSNKTLICNASDLQLKNITLFVWNSSSLFYNETKEISGQQNSSEFNVTNLSLGESYEWNCFACDLNNNCNFAENNFSFSVFNILTKQIFPSQKNHTNKKEINFSCQTFSNENYELKNLTLNIFYIQNESNITLFYNETKEISGFENETTFQINFTNASEGNYNWSCISFNNNSDFYETKNRSLVFDLTSPQIEIISFPEGNQGKGDKNLTFLFNASDSLSDEIFCNLIVNSQISDNKTFENSSENKNFTKQFSPGSYSIKVVCYDLAGNLKETEEKSFYLESYSISSGGGGGGGGSSRTSGSNNKILNTTQQQNQTTPKVENNSITKKEFHLKESLKEEKKISLKKEEKLIFQINQTNHSLIVNHIGQDFVNLTIRSEPINLILKIGEEKKINLTSKEYYDLYIKLESISEEKVNLIIKEINEKIINEEKTNTARYMRFIILFVVLILLILTITKIFKIIKPSKKDEKTKIKASCKR